MKNSPHKHEHLRKKCVRQSQSLPYQEEENHLTLENLKKDYHKSDLDHSILKKEEDLSSDLQGLERDIKRKKAKRRKKRSKRQQPGIEVDYLTEPESIHPEGKRWNEVVNKQARDRSKKLQYKLEHQKKSA